jgi:hypothetical protein
LEHRQFEMERRVVQEIEVKEVKEKRGRSERRDIEDAEKGKKKQIPHCGQQKALASVRDDMSRELGKVLRRSVEKK